MRVVMFHPVHGYRTVDTQAEVDNHINFGWTVFERNDVEVVTQQTVNIVPERQKRKYTRKAK